MRKSNAIAANMPPADPAGSNVNGNSVEPCSLNRDDELVCSNDDEVCVLIVDDEVETSEEIAFKLNTHGFTCLTAHDAHEALRKFEEEPRISIVISDIRMPGMDGIELLNQLKDQYEGKRDMALLMITGHAGTDEAIEALRVGVLDFLTKPLHPHQLVHATKRAAEHVRYVALERQFKEECRRTIDKKTRQIREMNGELLRSNERLAHASQAKTQFLRLISHELNTPLTQILGFSDLLQTDAGGAELNSHLKTMNRAGAELHQKMQSILEIVADDADHRELTMSRVSLQDTVGRAIGNSSAVLKQTSVSLKQIMPDKEIAFLADDRRLELALVQLIDNAAKFSLPGGEVTVAATLGQGVCSIAVRDQGMGMTDAETRRAIKPFTQVDGSLTRTHEGMGLGLTLARCVADMHEGSLTIDSSPGKGTTVILELPYESM